MKFRLVPTLLILLAMAVTIRLGFWQRDRAHQREAMEARIMRFEHAEPQTVTKAPIAASAIAYHRVRAHGRFMPGHVVYLDNRPYRDQPGFYVVMPLALDDGGYVLVNRGWLPRNVEQRTAIAPYRTPSGDVWVEGIARSHASRAFELGEGGSAAHQAIRQNIDVAAFAAETGLPLQPFVIQQANDTGDGLVRDWPRPITGADRNYGYMMQWWGMAAAALAFGLYAARRAGRQTVK